MRYSNSDATVVHPGTGRRMHQQTAAVPSAVSAEDMNMVIWGLMELLNAAGVTPATFDPATPASYQKVLQAVRALAGGSPVEFEPELRVNGSSAGITYTSRQGFWARRGPMVDVRAFIQVAGLGGATGPVTVSLTGLPATEAHTVLGCHVDGMAGLSAPLSGFLMQTSNIVEPRLFTPPTGQGVVITEANVAAGAVIYLNGTYKVLP